MVDMVSIVTVAKYVEGFIEDDAYKIKSYRDFIKDRFVYDSLVSQMLDSNSKDEVVALCETLAQRYKENNDERAYLILHKRVTGEYERRDIILTLD